MDKKYRRKCTRKKNNRRKCTCKKNNRKSKKKLSKKRKLSGGSEDNTDFMKNEHFKLGFLKYLKSKFVDSKSNKNEKIENCFDILIKQCKSDRNLYTNPITKRFNSKKWRKKFARGINVNEPYPFLLGLWDNDGKLCDNDAKNIIHGMFVNKDNLINYINTLNK
tara:strand:+ start:586 stop:1077 length:492 start_codon:yes stop_codon:yes gene_type:complete